MLKTEPQTNVCWALGSKIQCCVCAFAKVSNDLHLWKKMLVVVGGVRSSIFLVSQNKNKYSDIWFYVRKGRCELWQKKAVRTRSFLTSEVSWVGGPILITQRVMEVPFTCLPKSKPVTQARQRNSLDNEKDETCF